MVAGVLSYRQKLKRASNLTNAHSKEVETLWWWSGRAEHWPFLSEHSIPVHCPTSEEYDVLECCVHSRHSKKTNPQTLQKQWPNYSVALTHIRQYHVLKILVLPILFSRRSTSQNQGYSQKWWLIFHSHKSISPPGKKITRQGRERRMKSGKP